MTWTSSWKRFNESQNQRSNRELRENCFDAI